MQQPVDVKDLISKSTADVAISDLAKKGFEKVKVLNKNTINRLIEEAVERVVTARAEELSAKERQQVLDASQSEFQTLVKKFRSQEEEHGSEVQELRVKIAELRRENERMSHDLAARDASIADLEGKLAEPLDTGVPPSGLSEIRASIESLAKQLSQGFAGGARALGDAGPALEALLEQLGDGGTIESNVGEVAVKNAKAGGVSKNLERLRSLSRGKPAEEQSMEDAGEN